MHEYSPGRADGFVTGAASQTTSDTGRKRAEAHPTWHATGRVLARNVVRPSGRVLAKNLVRPSDRVLAKSTVHPGSTDKDISLVRPAGTSHAEASPSHDEASPSHAEADIHPKATATATADDAVVPQTEITASALIRDDVDDDFDPHDFPFWPTTLVFALKYGKWSAGIGTALALVGIAAAFMVGGNARWEMPVGMAFFGALALILFFSCITFPLACSRLWDVAQIRKNPWHASRKEYLALHANAKDVGMVTAASLFFLGFLLPNYVCHVVQGGQPNVLLPF